MTLRLNLKVKVLWRKFTLQTKILGQAKDMYNLKDLLMILIIYIFWLSRVGLGVNTVEKDLISTPHCCVVCKMGRLK